MVWFIEKFSMLFKYFNVKYSNFSHITYYMWENFVINVYRNVNFLMLLWKKVMKETYFVMCPKNHFCGLGNTCIICLKNKTRNNWWHVTGLKKTNSEAKHQIKNNQKTKYKWKQKSLLKNMLPSLMSRKHLY